MFAFSRLVAALVGALLIACGALAQQSDDPDDDDETAQLAPAPATGVLKPRAKPQPKLPLQELTQPILYDLLLAEVAAQRGDAAVAARTYADLAKRTRDPRVARRAVEIANKASMPDHALEAARIWHEADPDSMQGLQTLALLLVNRKKVDDAEPFLAKLLAAQGAAAANGFMQLGRLLSGNPDAAANLRVTQKLAQRYPELPQARFAVAQAAAVAKNEALALAEIRSAAELKPDWDVAALYEAQLLQARSAAEAAKRLAGHLEKYPDRLEIRLNYTRLLVADKRFAEARAEFERILERHKDDPEAIYSVGLLAVQVKEFAIAEANLKRLLDIGFRDPNGVRYTLGQIAEEQKDWPRAIDWYRTIQRGEHAVAARLRTALALGKQGKIAEARDFLRSSSASSEQERVQMLIAESQLLREANLHREAFELLGQALERNPEQTDLLYDHALSAEKVERFDVLEANLQKVIRLKPDNAHAYNALGYSLADRNLRLPEARKLIEKALELSPEDFFIVDSMGWVLYRMGDLKAAAAHLRRAWNGRSDGEIGAHLGEVLWTLGERDEARRVWGEALKSSPENEVLQKTIRRFAP
jgi:tetratricopeptide (TPR) repeat protein